MCSHYYLPYRLIKDYNETLWTTLCQLIRSLRQNEQIPRKTKITKTDSRNRQLE